MTEKEHFIEKMKKRTKQFAVDVIHFCESLNSSKELERLLIESNEIVKIVSKARNSISNNK